MIESYFQWSNDLTTGISSIDFQHRKLIDIINDVLRLCFNNDLIDEKKVSEIYKSLSLYVVEHFTSEQQIMKDFLVDSRHFAEHVRVHVEFKKTMNKLFVDHEALINPDKLGEVAEFLIRWLAYHILSMDKSLTRQIGLIQNEGLSPEEAYEREKEFVETSSEPLLKALRALFQLVTEKNNALNKANDELEEKVRVRTISLMEANKKLEEYSMQDELTGLPNRRYAFAEIEQLINNWKRYGGVFSVLFIDVDKFKAVNDNFGHEYGDKVLKWVATFLRAHLRSSDIPCRLGGDEFLIICSQCNAENAMKLGIKISEASRVYSREEIANSWEPSISIGIAEVDHTCETVNDILKKADHAMYNSKKQGGGLVTLAENN
ncbi:MAG: GGDEF domain-containing protein [Firmicutes bacterium HGW-Firmicutes-3]|jgi:hemerythrin|nr:MAG: GGDEF domain-containing protein [Firmicutes bacterium HGW-Firmicutes-3]